MNEKDQNQDALCSSSEQENNVCYLRKMYSSWKKIQWLFIIFSLLSINIITYSCLSQLKTSISVICSHVGLDLSLPRHIIIFVLLLFAVIVLTMVIYIVLHEFIHYLFHFNMMKYCKIKFSAIAISIFSDCWIAKYHELLIIIAPLVFIEGLIIWLSITTKSMFLFLLVSLINFSFSSSDIFAFFYLLFMTPSGSFIKGNAYKHQ